MTTILFPMSADLPPEAFTKETLQQAFNWLQEQPEPVRKSVHTPERLVSLFRKSQRLGQNDAPVSSKKFISDLKNLATSLDQFDEPSSAPISPQAPFDFSSQVTPEAPLPADDFIESKPAPPKTPSSASTKTSRTTLDALSQERLTKVRTRLNLGTDQEALRMLISLGFEKFSELE
ncbi:MAG: hypothetical protein AAF203_02480 [Pseudomonadota bacterium]